MRRRLLCSLALSMTCVVPEGTVTQYDPTVAESFTWVDSTGTCDPFVIPETLWVAGVPYRQDLVGCR